MTQLDTNQSSNNILHGQIVELKAQIEELRTDVAGVKTDMASILDLIKKFWEQFQEMKNSPMLSAFFPAPRKK